MLSQYLEIMKLFLRIMNSMSLNMIKTHLKVNIPYVDTVSGIFKSEGIAYLSSMVLKYQVEGSYYIQLISHCDFIIWLYK